MSFHVTHRDGSARTGELTLAHGIVRTPVFMPVGTRAAVRTLTSGELAALGAEIVLANTYHLWLRPGTELIAQAGGLHGFMAWDKPILTDSGGFQVFSLGPTRTVDDDGVTFRSVYDGSTQRLTPETATAAQEALGADIAMVLDECVSLPAEPAALKEAVDRSAAWAARCKEAHEQGRAAGTAPAHGREGGQLLFGILQGGTDLELRAESAARTVEIGFGGYAIGGLSVGEPRERMLATVAHTAPLLPADAPRYLMGVGDPVSLIEAVALGIDMFDCVLPTRMARNGAFWGPEGRMNLRNARYADDLGPLDDTCDCPACRTYSRAYLRHLLMAKEVLPLRMLTEHNLRVLVRGMADARNAIMAECFEEFLAGWRGRFTQVGDEDEDGDRDSGSRS